MDKDAKAMARYRLQTINWLREYGNMLRNSGEYNTSAHAPRKDWDAYLLYRLTVGPWALMDWVAFKASSSKGDERVARWQTPTGDRLIGVVEKGQTK